MTAKRFTVKQRQGATIYSIEDYYGELPLNEGIYYKSNADKLCEWLNTQHELLNTLYNENEQLKKELKRCRRWLNSDKYDYELTLAFIKNKGYSLKDVLEYEKELG